MCYVLLYVLQGVTKSSQAGIQTVHNSMVTSRQTWGRAMGEYSLDRLTARPLDMNNRQDYAALTNARVCGQLFSVCRCLLSEVCECVVCRLLQNYFKYANAAYGWMLYSFAHLCTCCCKLTCMCSKLACCDGATGPTVIHGDTCFCNEVTGSFLTLWLFICSLVF